MALQKDTELASGVTANYYRISEMVVRKLRIKIKVELYLDEAARLANKSPIMDNCYQKVIGALPQGFSFVASNYDADFFSEAYTYLKTLPMFEGASDV